MLCVQTTRWRKATDAVCRWLIHEKLQEEGHQFHPKDGTPWTKVHRPSAAFCFYFVQYVHDRHFPLLGSLGDADRVLADIKKLKVAGGAGVTNVLRDRVEPPIAKMYIEDQMPDAYEVQASLEEGCVHCCSGCMQLTLRSLLQL